MSRFRSLKGLAHNLADKFSISCEHFAYLSDQHNIPTISMDLIQGTITPACFSSPRNLNLLRMCQGDLCHHMARTDANTILLASLEARFMRVADPVDAEPSVCSTVTVCITDTCHRQWTYSIHRPNQRLCP